MTHEQEKRAEEKVKSVKQFLAALPSDFPGREFLMDVARMDTRYFDNPLFHDPAAVEALFQRSLSFDVASLEAAWNMALCDADYEFSPLARKLVLTPDEEKTVFLQYNYARFKVASYICLADKGPILKIVAIQAVRWAQVMKRTRDTLVVSNLGLVFSMGRRTGIFAGGDVSELLTEGFSAIMRAVDGFNLDKGFKFSTYACRSVIQSMNREKAKMVKRLQKEFPSSLDITPDCKIETPDDGWEASLRDLKLVLSENRARLNANEKLVIEHRFFNGKKLHEVGPLLQGRLTKERVRQIQNKAINKIKEALNA